MSSNGKCPFKHPSVSSSTPPFLVFPATASKYLSSPLLLCLVCLLNEPSSRWLQSAETRLFVMIQWLSAEGERHSTASLRAEDSLHTGTSKTLRGWAQSSVLSQGRNRVRDRLRWIRMVSVGHASTFLDAQEATVRLLFLMMDMLEYYSQQSCLS